ncbi:MAG: hypothetical protein ACPGWS_04045 [Solirubrobacterales bacterium]
MGRDWETLREGLEKQVFRKSVDTVARELPADRVTVYRLIQGITKNPSKATRAAVERLVDEAGAAPNEHLRQE